MRIVIISNTCSEEEYMRQQEIKFAEKISPQQHFFSSLIDGFISNGCEVTCISSRPISKSNTNVAYLEGYTEEVSSRLKFIYLPVKANGLLRNFKLFKDVRRAVKNDVKKGDYIVFDPLSIAICYGAMSKFVIRRAKKLAVVTDLPMYITAIEKGRKFLFSKMIGNIRQKLFLNMIAKMNSLCFLTKSMELINKKKVPTIVVEGMISQSVDFMNCTIVDDKKVVLYAGGLYEKFGIKNLVEAAKGIKKNEFELHLYGEGNCIDYINKTTKSYPHIQYRGVLGQKEIKAAERQATILINPRPTDEDFTKYSFPSKTLEYMSTGRPVLTTKLAGIPIEYYEYLYVIQNHTSIGIQDALKAVLSLPDQELNKKGLDALEFVLRCKNAKYQTQRIIALLEAI